MCVILVVVLCGLGVSSVMHDLIGQALGYFALASLFGGILLYRMIKHKGCLFRKC